MYQNNHHLRWNTTNISKSQILPMKIQIEKFKENPKVKISIIITTQDSRLNYIASIRNSDHSTIFHLL
jgi:hypothetical protein